MMNEAEFTADLGKGRLGWAQVGLETGIQLTTALLPLVQCLVEATNRFGVTTLSGLQVFAFGLEPSPNRLLGHLVSVLNWFSLKPGAEATADLALRCNMPGGHAGGHVLSLLQQFNTGPFTFELAESVPEQHRVQMPEEAGHLLPGDTDMGLKVSLPERSVSAAGWALAIVTEAVRKLDPEMSDIAIRLTMSSGANGQDVAD